MRATAGLLLIWGVALAGCGDDPAHEVVCGDGLREGDEACDTADLGGVTCADQGLPGDGLACDEACELDTQGCTGCGNELLEDGEDCDATNLGGQTCPDLGFGGGTLACGEGCAWVLSRCVDGCGNGVRETGEACDGTDLAELTCARLGFHDGVVTCDATCFPDTSGCGPPLAPFGAACVADADCLSGRCLTEPGHGLPAGTCTADCYNLGQGLECLEPDAICACVDPDCVGQSCLLTCTPGGPNPCRDGYACVDQGGGEGACQPRCSDHAQCVITGVCDTTAGSPTLGYCRVPPELCGNSADDDLDGRADCEDPDCNPVCPAGEICDNTVDDDSDGLADCADGECAFHTHCTGIACAAAGPLPTDATLLAQSNGQTGAATAIDDWCGSGSHQWTGPELVYELTVTANTGISVDLVGATADVDLLVLTDGPHWGACNPHACLTQSTGASTGSESVTFEARPGSTYWVVVDGWQGAVATYDLVVSTTPGELCGNATDDDGDGLVDCADPSCFGQPGCTTEQTCGDGLDNDTDGDADCADPDCAAHAWCLATPLLTEGFDLWPPPGWTVEDGGPDGYTWQQCTLCAETLAAATGPYAVVSSDLAGPTWPLVEGLVTPPVDLTGRTAAWLQFSHHFEDRPPSNQNDFALVETSTDATNWTPIAFWATTTGRTELLDLSSLAGQPQAYVRFRYTDGNTWAWYWAIDTITIKAN